MLSNQKIELNEFSLDIIFSFKSNELSIYKPYYCFYLWLIRKRLKFKDSTSKTHKDNMTNIVYDDDVNIIGFHSWYARVYGGNKKHTERIDVLLNNIEISGLSKPNFVLWKNYTFKYTQYFSKFFRKVKMKLK